MSLLRFYWSTTIHKFGVARRLLRVAAALAGRAATHDLSKFLPSEARGFSEGLPEMGRVPYGTEAYREAMSQGELRAAVARHHRRNRHHPEHFDKGVRGMDLVDLVEMLADWAEACHRTPQGGLSHSIEFNSERFNLDWLLARLLDSTARRYFGRDM
jgi:hypothetical protein